MIHTRKRLLKFGIGEEIKISHYFYKRKTREKAKTNLVRLANNENLEKQQNPNEIVAMLESMTRSKLSIEEIK